MIIVVFDDQSWQFSANSIHYLLGFWQRLVGSVPYIKSSEVHLLDKYIPEVGGTEWLVSEDSVCDMLSLVCRSRRRISLPVWSLWRAC